MAETTRDYALYFKMGVGFYRFICCELNSGKKYRKNRGIVLLHMIERASYIPKKEFFKGGQRLEQGECFISRSEIQRACNLTEAEVRAAVNWLKNNGHIKRNYHLTAHASVGTFYIVAGLASPEIYKEYEKNAKEEDAKKADFMGIVENSDEENQPSTLQKQPSEDGEKKLCLSTFPDAGGGENSQNNIIGFPVGNSTISVDNSYTRSKTQRCAHFEQFKTPENLKKYILSATHRSRHDRNKYICPFCGSGTKKNGTGALSIDKRRGGTSWHCFACGRKGDIYDFAGYLYNVEDKNEQLQIVAQFVTGHPLFFTE